MLLTTTTFICTSTTGPKYWIAWSTQGESITKWSYGYVVPGQHVSTGQAYLEILDTELELSNRVNTLRQEDGWYDTCENRIPPGIPVDWECVDGIPTPSVQ